MSRLPIKLKQTGKLEKQIQVPDYKSLEHDIEPPEEIILVQAIGSNKKQRRFRYKLVKSNEK